MEKRKGFEQRQFEPLRGSADYANRNKTCDGKIAWVMKQVKGEKI